MLEFPHLRPLVGLTPRQIELLTFIKGHISSHGLPPTYREMMAGIGATSKSNVHHLLVQLEGRGAIKRLRGRTRAIRVREAA